MDIGGIHGHVGVDTRKRVPTGGRHPLSGTSQALLKRLKHCSRLLKLLSDCSRTAQASPGHSVDGQLQPLVEPQPSQM